MTKLKGQAASFAPAQGRVLFSASAVALGAAIAIVGSAVQAGSCNNEGGGIFTCSGAAGSSSGSTRDETIRLVGGDQPLHISTQPGFGINAIGEAFSMTAGAGGVTFSDTNNSQITGGTTAVSISDDAVGETGDISFSTSGTVTAGLDGINIRTNQRSAVTLNVADVSGSNNGIRVNNLGGGDVLVRSSGTISGGSGGPFRGRGILVSHSGPGGVVIDVADVESASDRGVFIRSRSGEANADVSISASGHISAQSDGVLATKDGGGDLSIRVSDVTSRAGVGIFALNASESAGISVQASGTVTSRQTGIQATNNGTGALTVQAAEVTSNNGFGIDANNSAEGTSISVTTSGAVSGRIIGVEVENRGTGALTVQAAQVTGRDQTGISAFNSSQGTDLSITASGAVSGRSSGIGASNNGAGALRIEAAQVTGNRNDGITAIGDDQNTEISITTTDRVRGGRHGIGAVNFGTGALSITVSGIVEGGTGNGIHAATSGNQLSIIELLDGAAVSASSGEAIRNNIENSRVTLRSGSSVAGAVRLDGGRDVLTIEGGADISAATVFDGGRGTDALIFSGFTGVFEAEKFDSFESLTAQDGGNLMVNSADVGGFTSIQVNSGAGITAQNANFSFSNDFSVGTNGRFLAGAAGAGRVTLGGRVLNDGLISLADGATGDQVTVGGTLSGTGTIELDVNLTDGTHDQLQVNGDTAGARQGMHVTTIGSTVDTAHIFTLVTVDGNSTESDFQLVNADFFTNDGAQAISDGNLVYRLAYDGAAGTYFLTPFDTDPDTGDGGDVNENPGGVFFAAGVQQVVDHLTFGAALQRVLGATQREASDTNTVSRALSELTSTTRPLVWVQGEGQRDSYSIDDRDVETNSGGLRFGAAFPLTELANGTLVGGLEFGISSLSTDVTTSLTGAEISTDAFDATLSLLWVANSQLYVDGQLRYGKFGSDIRPKGGQSVDIGSDGYGLSIEVGKPYELANGMTLVPQAQLMYSDVDSDNVVDLAGGEQVGSLVDGDTLTARVGLRAEHTLAGNAVLYGQVDYYHAFENATSVSFGQSTIQTERDKNTAGLRLGGIVALSESTALFGELTGETGIGSNFSDYAFGGNIGIEVRF